MLKVRNHSKAGLLKTMFSASLLLCSTAAMAQSQKIEANVNQETTIVVDIEEEE